MQKHIILTLGRSGSNYLVTALNQHPEVVNYGEVLGPWTTLAKFRSRVWPDEPSDAYLDRIYSSAPVFFGGQVVSAISHKRKGRPIRWHQRSKVRQIGIKEFATNFEKHELADYLTDRRDIRVICLDRENVLRRYLSNEFLRKNRRVRNSTGSAQHETVVLDPKTMIGELETFTYERQLLRGLTEVVNPVLHLTYEKIFDPATKSETLQQVYQFLGVAPITLDYGDFKLNSGTLDALIANYDEVQETLTGTKYEHFLES